MTTDTNPRNEARTAIFAALGAYMLWGSMPLAMQAMSKAGAGAWEILAHRIIWGAAVAGLFVVLAKQGAQVMRVVREPRTLGLLGLSAGLIAINWVVFIWAVNSGHVLQTSLGYYINPLMNMAAGVVMFREKLPRIGLIAIIFALIGVVIQAVALGGLPWVSLFLAFTFGAYGIVRKYVSADAQTGLFLECLILIVPCLIYVVWLGSTGQAGFGHDVPVTLWLLAAGPITAVPLALFAWAARRMPLSAMGFLQFIAPTMSFAIGVMQGEEFHLLNAISFAFIWAGAVTFVIGAVRAARMQAAAVQSAA